jgi:hypothetical protein
MRTSSRVILLLTVVLACGGCAVAMGAAAGYGTLKYLTNQTVREYHTDVRTAHDAARAVLGELGYGSQGPATLGPTEFRVDAGDAAVAGAELPDDRVRIAVSVGTFESADHRRRAALIHEKLAERLGPTAKP